MQAEMSKAETRNPLIRFVAHFISILFHPLLITCYVIAFLLFVHPFLFAGFGNQLKLFRFLSVFVTSFFLPVFSIFLCWRLGFVQSMLLRSARDRIIPYVIVMVFYFWVWYVYHNQEENPPESVAFLLGSFLAVCGAWFCNIFFKISMHATAAGGLVMFFLLFSFHDPYASGLYLSLSILLGGLICSARLIVSDHHPVDIYAGLLVGMISEALGWVFNG
jgi:hypothetical protein